MCSSDLTAAMISCSAAVPSTDIEFVSRLTVQELTPLTFETAFSTLALQAAQLIPFTSYCSILSPHHALNRIDQLVDGVLSALFDIRYDAGMDMRRE